MDNNKQAFKSGIWYTLSNFFINGLAFLTTPIFARLMTKSEYGEYNNYISWLTIVTIVVTLNLEATLISARYDYEEDFDGYISSILSLSTLSVLCWWMIVNLFHDFFTNFWGLSCFSINMMFLYLLFLPAINLFLARERYFFRYKSNIIISLLQALGVSGLSVLLVVFMKDKMIGRVIGNTVFPVIIGIVLYTYIIIIGKTVKIKYWRYAVKICIPFIPHLLSLNILNSMDRVMINKICGAEDTAVYSLAYTCGLIVTILLNALNSAFGPWLGEKLACEEYSIIKSFSRKYISVFCFLALGIMLVAPEVLLILGGKAYLSAIYVIPPVAMGCVCQFLYVMYVNIEQFEKKTVGMAFASVSAALLNYVTNSVFIPRYGYEAAAYTTLLGYLWLLLVHMYLVYRMRMHMVYDNKFVFMLVGIGLLSMVGIMLTYNHIIIRLLLVVVYIGVLIIATLKNKEQIMKFIKKEK